MQNNDVRVLLLLLSGFARRLMQVSSPAPPDRMPNPAEVPCLPSGAMG